MKKEKEDPKKVPEAEQSEKKAPAPHQKIGAGHASAMWRQGLRELRGALYSESNVAQPSEYGLYGTMTPGEVAEARRPDDDNSKGKDQEDPNKQEGSILQRELNRRDDKDPGDDHGPDLDR